MGINALFFDPKIRDYVFLPMVILMFFVNFWMCALLRIHVLDGCAVAGALVAQAAALNKTAAACLWQEHHGGQSAQDSGR